MDCVMKYNYSPKHPSLSLSHLALGGLVGRRAGGRGGSRPSAARQKDVPSALLRMGEAVRVKGAICPGDVWGETAIYVRSC